MLFFIQVALLLSYLKTEYHISLKDIIHEHISLEPTQMTSFNEPTYTAYYSEDILGDDILLLDNLPEKKKLEIWKNTSTKNKIIDYFPKMEMMKMAFINNIEDNGNFKVNFLEYMEEQHLKYIAGEISSEEFKESILNPSSSLSDTW